MPYTPKPQQCRNGCGTEIIVKQVDGKWKPFNNASGELHECPNSDYNKKKGVKGNAIPSGISGDFLSERIDTIEAQIQRLTESISKLTNTVNGFFQAWTAEHSFKEASTQTEE